MFENTDRRRQSTRFIRQVFTKRKVYFGGYFGQHSEIMGLFKGKVLEDIHRTQKREILHLREFFRYWWKGMNKFFVIKNCTRIVSYISSGLCLEVKTTWFIFGIFKARRLFSDYKDTPTLFCVQLAIPPRTLLRQLLWKTTKPLNCGRVILKTDSQKLPFLS